jgi:hypothetical protein
MSAANELIAYGYQLFPDGRYRRLGKRTQVWEPTEGGWLRFEIGPDGAEVPEVHSVAESHKDVSGLDKGQSPEAFNWVYPEAEVELIYKSAVTAAAEG